MDQKSKILLTAALIFIGLGLILIWQIQAFGRLRLVFCDVGQGDGILMVSPGGKQVLVDGGPGRKIVDCLGQNLPFWDRTLEMIVLTHPQRDHLEGLVEVLARYKVKMIITTGVKNETAVFDAWQKALEVERARIYKPNAGDRLAIDRTTIDVLWPSVERLNFWQTDPPKELNDSSIVTRVNFGQICVYLTADIPKEILETLIDKPCQILKVSHHGSKTGTNEEVLAKIMPQLAIIQVGRNNFGHPHKEVLDLLQSKGVKILRSDTNGTIDVGTSGRTFAIKTEKSN